MAAAVQRHPSDSGFVGQVLVRKSPILTWRPALAASLVDEAEEYEDVETLVAMDPVAYDAVDVARPSRLATRRMIAWPVAGRVVRQSTAERAWKIAVRAVATVAVLAVVALVAASAPWPSAPHSSMIAARASATRTLAEGRDALGGTATSNIAQSPAKVDRGRTVPRHSRRARALISGGSTFWSPSRTHPLRSAR